jgi:hypothetical protein
VEKVEVLARASESLNLALFVHELIQVVWLLIGLFESPRTPSKGKLMRISLRAVASVRKNPEPVLPARQRMGDHWLKWGN